MNGKKIIAILLVCIAVIIGGMIIFIFLKDKVINKSDKSKQPQLEEIPNSTVRLTSSGFEPKNINISKRMRVIWINESGEKASINSDDHPKHTKYYRLNLGEFVDKSSVQLIFDKAGTYSYHNHLNPEQKGTITVK